MSWRRKPAELDRHLRRLVEAFRDDPAELGAIVRLAEASNDRIDSWGWLRDDGEALRRVVGLNPRPWARFWPRLQPFLERDAAGRVRFRFFATVQKHREMRSAKGRQGGLTTALKMLALTPVVAAAGQSYKAARAVWVAKAVALLRRLDCSLDQMLERINAFRRAVGLPELTGFDVSLPHEQSPANLVTGRLNGMIAKLQVPSLHLPAKPVQAELVALQRENRVRRVDILAALVLTSREFLGDWLARGPPEGAAGA